LKYPKYVQVSPDAPDAWWDPKSGMWFKKADGIIELKDGLDASNIVRYIRFNYLIDATSLVNPPAKEEQKTTKFVEQTPRQLLKDDEAKEKAAKEAKTEEPKSEEPATESTQEIEEPEVEEAETKEETKDKEACPYCGKEYFPKGLPNHMKSCKKNPDNQ